MNSSDLVYVTRNNLLTTEWRWEISEEGINLTQLSGIQLIKWDNIREIRLQYAPTRFIANRYTCAINQHSGGTIWFSSHYYQGFNDFRNDGLTYAKFVTKLIETVGQKNPNCNFTSGSGRLYYLFNLSVMIFTGFLLVVIAKLLLALGLTWMVGVKLLMIFFLIPRALRWLRYNHGQNFNGSSIPVGLLPEK